MGNQNRNMCEELCRSFSDLFICCCIFLYSCFSFFYIRFYPTVLGLLYFKSAAEYNQNEGWRAARSFQRDTKDLRYGSPTRPQAAMCATLGMALRLQRGQGGCGHLRSILKPRENDIWTSWMKQQTHNDTTQHPTHTTHPTTHNTTGHNRFTKEIQNRLTLISRGNSNFWFFIPTSQLVKISSLCVGNLDSKKKTIKKRFGWSCHLLRLIVVMSRSDWVTGENLQYNAYNVSITSCLKT